MKSIAGPGARRFECREKTASSSGAIEALQAIARGLPKDFDATLFVVLHASSESPGFLLLAEKTEAVEDSLWSSIRAIEGTVLLMRQMAAHIEESHEVGAAAGPFRARADEGAAQRRPRPPR